MLRGMPHLTVYMPEARDARRLIPDPENEPDLYKISVLYPVGGGNNSNGSPSVRSSSPAAMPSPIIKSVAQRASVPTKNIPIAAAITTTSTMKSPMMHTTPHLLPTSLDPRLTSEVSWLSQQISPSKVPALSIEAFLPSINKKPAALAPASVVAPVAAHLDVAQVRSLLQSRAAIATAAENELKLRALMESTRALEARTLLETRALLQQQQQQKQKQEELQRDLLTLQLLKECAASPSSAVAQWLRLQQAPLPPR
jgi:hypothetical protein